jgi:hypothetical protein
MSDKQKVKLCSDEEQKQLGTVKAFAVRLGNLTEATYAMSLDTRDESHGIIVSVPQLEDTLKCRIVCHSRPIDLCKISSGDTDIHTMKIVNVTKFIVNI